MVKRMEGKVFSEKIPARALADYEKKLCIVNLKNEPDGDITIRYLGDRPETEDSVSEEPRLEDLYLWLFPQNTDGRKKKREVPKEGKDDEIIQAGIKKGYKDTDNLDSSCGGPSFICTDGLAAGDF